MAFKKGTSGNPNGRPKGSMDKVGLEVREKLKAVVCGYLESDGLANDLAGLTASERVRAYTKLTEFVLPRLQAVSVEDGQQKEEEVRPPIEWI